MSDAGRVSGQQRGVTGRRAVLLTIGVVLLAANLRPTVASVGPVLADLRSDLGLSATGAAVLTALPVLCFGLLAPLAPRLSRRVGLERALALVLAAVLVGQLIRVGAGYALLLAGTAVAAGGIALGNVLVPALVKRDFPDRTGRLTGLYTMAIAGSASVTAGLTVPAARALPGEWRAGLVIWAVPALVALAVWVAVTGSGPPTRPAAGSASSLLRTPLAWQVTGFFGLQSLGFYSVLAWLPSIYRGAGIPPTTAGLLLSVATVLGVPVALVVPTVATRLTDQRLLAAGATGTTALGYAGLLLAPSTAPYLWAVLIGLGLGAAFPLALTLLVLRTQSEGTAARLSAMTQSVGYTLSAGGPFLVGVFFDLTGSWSPSVGLLLVLLVPQAVLGILAGRARTVEDPPRRTSGPIG